MMTQRNARPRFGFTLIELLVVIAIIAILAAILFPVFAQARESARLSACSSNVRQVTLAFRQYTQDYDESLPPRRLYVDNSPGALVTANWKHIVQPYVKNFDVFKCPSNPASKFYDESDPALGMYAAGVTPTYRGYFYFQAFYKQGGNTSGFQNYKEVVFDYPSNTILIGESKSTTADFGPWIGLNYANYGAGKFPGTNWGAFHRGSDRKVNIGFLDGHVKFTDWTNTCKPSNPDNTNMWAYNPDPSVTQPFTPAFCADLQPAINKGKFP